ncbi:hypothetical protein M405DRAFT_890637 [Rhizopogon salebrosus TDB-379]|nr:hypothetical protein M405DRAFT_890637 [Rhizopogon salebrosus TDB-379]
MTDVVILTNCRHFNIPAYIVRFKAGQHIRSLIRDMEYCTTAMTITTNRRSSIRLHESNLSRGPAEALKITWRMPICPVKKFTSSRMKACSVLRRKSSR